MARKPTQGNVISFPGHTQASTPDRSVTIHIRKMEPPRRLQQASIKAMIDGLAHVSLMPREVANANGLGDLVYQDQPACLDEYPLTLEEFRKPYIFHQALRTDAYRYVEDNYQEIVDNFRESGTARQVNASFANLAFGLITALENRIQCMAANGCSELIPLLHAFDNVHEAAANAMHTLSGGVK